MQIYQSHFPHLQIVGALNPQVLTQMNDIIGQVKKQNPKARIYYVFDGLRERGRPQGDEHRSRNLAETGNCPNKVVIDKHSKHTNLVICKFE
jgi:hypothetical protein